MGIADILEQAKALNRAERKELVKALIDTLGVDELPSRGKSGAEIAALLRSMDPVEFVDPHLEDPVKWVKAQRAKRAARWVQDADSEE